jgi:hypothetical protein
MLAEYDDAHPSRDPAFEPPTMNVTLTVTINVPAPIDPDDRARKWEALDIAKRVDNAICEAEIGEDVSVDVEDYEVASE